MSFPAAVLLPISDGDNTGSLSLAGSAPQATYYQSVNTDNGSVDVVQTSVAGSFTCGLQPLPAALSVMAVTVRMSVVDDLVGGGLVRSFLEYGGVRYYGVSGGWYTLPDTNYHDVDTVIVGVFTPAQMRNMRIGWESGTPAPGGRHSVSFLRATAPYVPEPPSVDASRDVASRRVWVRRRGDRRITVVGGVALLDYRPGSRIDLSHLAGIHATGEGWKNTIRDRRPLWVEAGPNWDPATKQATLVCIDHRPKLCLMYDSGWAKVGGVTRDGLMYMTPGALRTMTRSTLAEFQDATGQLVSVPINVEAFASRGQVIQAGRTNVVKNSAFALTGVDTNWTSFGEGSNGSNILAETADGMWTTDISPRCLKILAGTPIHAGDLQHQSDTIMGLADVPHTLSVYHQDTGDVLSWGAQRGDAKYYRESDQTWQVAKTWNSFPLRTTWARDSVTWDPDGAWNMTLFLGVPTTGTAGQSSLVAHVQLEAGAYAMSPIFTMGAAFSRGADDLQIENNATQRTLNAAQFTVMVEAEPFWSPSDLANSTAKNLWYAYHDANNNLLVRYYKTAGGVSEWQAILTAAGVSYTAIASAAPAPGTRETITVRFTGERGELGVAPYTLGILVDGLLGATTVIAAQPMIEAATAYIQYAGWDGYVRQRFSSPQVLSDAEIARGI